MKKIVSLIVVIACIFSLSACSNENEMDKKALEKIQELIVSESSTINSIEEIKQTDRKETADRVVYTYNVTYTDSILPGQETLKTYNADYSFYVIPTEDKKDFVVDAYFPVDGTLKEIK